VTFHLTSEIKRKSFQIFQGDFITNADLSSCHQPLEFESLLLVVYAKYLLLGFCKEVQHDAWGDLASSPGPYKFGSHLKFFNHRELFGSEVS
jgi:hypothetical protein